MKNKNYTIDNNWIIKYALILVGCTISSIGINGFTRPASLLSGGVSGISIAINSVTSINTGILMLIINIPFFIIGIKYLDKNFCITSAINVFVLSTILGLTENIHQFIQVEDLFLQTIFGGLLNGIGMGIIFKAKSSGGGIDILAAILKIKKNIPIKNTSMVINTFIVMIGGILFGVEKALFTLISIYVSSNAMNVTKNMFNKQKAIMIISNKYEEIAKDIIEIMGRGVTFIQAQGAYTQEEKKIIYCIVYAKEIPRVKDISLKHDENSMISINNLDEVKGNGFRDTYL